MMNGPKIIKIMSKSLYHPAGFLLSASISCGVAVAPGLGKNGSTSPRRGFDERAGGGGIGGRARRDDRAPTRPMAQGDGLRRNWSAKNIF